ncbi:MAG TPA: DUF1643 domain-containing protein [Ktedonobacteraceae bacterium]|nr:DUF1643 domain-containing protein [Ktedonobacteraceae bacterium]
MARTELYSNSGAIFDKTDTYRYTLWRVWSLDYPRITFIMLNPSTADAQRNDLTISRCIAFARSWGFGALDVVNLFAYKATHPGDLLKDVNPVGEENDQFLMQAFSRSSCVVAAWGTKGTLLDRDKQVLQLLAYWQNIHCLGVTKDGHPRHPLYVNGHTGLIPFYTPPAAGETKH